MYDDLAFSLRPYLRQLMVETVGSTYWFNIRCFTSWLQEQQETSDQPYYVLSPNSTNMVGAIKMPVRYQLPHILATAYYYLYYPYQLTSTVASKRCYVQACLRASDLSDQQRSAYERLLNEDLKDYIVPLAKEELVILCALSEHELYQSVCFLSDSIEQLRQQRDRSWHELNNMIMLLINANIQAAQSIRDQGLDCKGSPFVVYAHNCSSHNAFYFYSFATFVHQWLCEDLYSNIQADLSNAHQEKIDLVNNSQPGDSNVVVPNNLLHKHEEEAQTTAGAISPEQAALNSADLVIEQLDDSGQVLLVPNDLSAEPKDEAQTTEDAISPEQAALNSADLVIEQLDDSEQVLVVPNELSAESKDEAQTTKDATSPKQAALDSVDLVSGQDKKSVDGKLTIIAKVDSSVVANDSFQNFDLDKLWTGDVNAIALSFLAENDSIVSNKDHNQNLSLDKGVVESNVVPKPKAKAKALYQPVANKVQVLLGNVLYLQGSLFKQNKLNALLFKVAYVFAQCLDEGVCQLNVDHLATLYDKGLPSPRKPKANNSISNHDYYLMIFCFAWSRVFITRHVHSFQDNELKLLGCNSIELHTGRVVQSIIRAYAVHLNLSNNSLSKLKTIGDKCDWDIALRYVQSSLSLYVNQPQKTDLKSDNCLPFVKDLPSMMLSVLAKRPGMFKKSPKDLVFKVAYQFAQDLAANSWKKSTYQLSKLNAQTMPTTSGTLFCPMNYQSLYFVCLCLSWARAYIEIQLPQCQDKNLAKIDVNTWKSSVGSLVGTLLKDHSEHLKQMAAENFQVKAIGNVSYWNKALAYLKKSLTVANKKLN